MRMNHESICPGISPAEDQPDRARPQERPAPRGIAPPSELLSARVSTFYDIRNVKKETIGMCASRSQPELFLLLPCGERRSSGCAVGGIQHTQEQPKDERRERRGKGRRSSYTLLSHSVARIFLSTVLILHFSRSPLFLFLFLPACFSFHRTLEFPPRTAIHACLRR